MAWPSRLAPLVALALMLSGCSSSDDPEPQMEPPTEPQEPNGPLPEAPDMQSPETPEPSAEPPATPSQPAQPQPEAQSNPQAEPEPAPLPEPGNNPLESIGAPLPLPEASLPAGI